MQVVGENCIFRLHELLLYQQKDPIRFWIEEYAFSEGETTLLREQIEVRLPASMLAKFTVVGLAVVDRSGMAGLRGRCRHKW